MRKEKYYFGAPKKVTKYYVFMGIIAFLIAFPIIAVNLRFQVGYVFSRIFDYVGSISLTVGGAIMLISLLQILATRRLNVKWVIVGITLLWVGCWCTGTVINLFGLGNENINPGYH
ncbi:MAG: hypothetical protein ACFFE4_01595 [Candidatus Thorarchaeota archaeon]